MEVDIKEEERRKARAYDILKEVCSDAELETLAEAAAKSSVPDSGLTDLFLMKALYNKTMFSECDDLVKMVSRINRQGLYKRPYGTAPAARRRERAAGVPVQPGIDSTSKFRQAAAFASPYCEPCGLPLFRTRLEQGAGRWRQLHKASGELFANGCDLEVVVGETIRMLTKEAGTSSHALVPVDRYLAFVLADSAYKKNLEAWKAIAEATRANLLLKPKGANGTFTSSRLPVGRAFVKNFLGNKFVGYSKEYFARHQLSVWNDALDAWHFSLFQRGVDAAGQAQELLRRLMSLLDKERADAFARRKLSVDLFGVMRDAESDPFGYRTAMFGVYDADAAAEIALHVARARISLLKNNHRRKDIVLRLLKRDLFILGASMTMAVPAKDMVGFCELFGTKRIW